MRLRKGLLLAALAGGLIWTAAAQALSGAGAVTAVKNGGFVVRYFNGTQAGVDSAVAFCTPGGTVSIGPGMEAISPTGTVPSTVLVIRTGQTGWTLSGNGATAAVPRLGPASTTTTGGAIRIVNGVTFPLTVAGVQAALDECEAAGGGETWVPAQANIQVSTTGVKVPNRVKLRGLGSLGNPATFVCTSTCNVPAVIENKTTDGTQQYCFIENLAITGSRAGGATDSFGIRLRSVFVQSAIKDVLVFNVKGVGVCIDAAGGNRAGPIYLENLWINTTDDDGIRIGASTGMAIAGVWMHGMDVERWGTGKAGIRLSGSCTPSASLGGVIDGAYLEQNADATAEGIVVSGFSVVNIENVVFNGAGAINYPIKIAGAGTDAICKTYSVEVSNVYANNDTILFDQPNNIAVTNANGSALARYRTPAKTPTFLPNLVASDSLRVMQLLQFGPTTFANLGTPANGVFRYCSDCTKATPCAGSGTGGLAKRINGAWDCN